MVHIAEEEKKDEKKEGTDGKIECPTCGAKVASDATECPECGEKLGEEAKEETEEELDEEEDEEDELGEEPQPSSSTFYAGILVFLLGIALVFGAVIHALYDWPNLSGGKANPGFGTFEKVIAVVGVLFFLIGLGLIAVSMKKPAAPGEEEEEEEGEEEEKDEEEDEEEPEEEEKKDEKEEDEEDEEEEEKEDKKKK